MAKYIKSHDDLMADLSEQIQALRASMDAYDKGNLWEGKRLATTAYNLIHDDVKGRTKSLLGQLGMRTRHDYTSSIIRPYNFRKTGWSSENWLVRVEMGGGTALFAPKLNRDASRYRSLSFREWYDEPIFQKDQGGQYVSRKNLIYSLRSQDGGSHVDASLSVEGYYDWKFRGDPMLSVEVNGESVTLWGPMIDLQTGEAVPHTVEGSSPILNGPLASMRQISWELDQYIKVLGF